MKDNEHEWHKGVGKQNRGTKCSSVTLYTAQYSSRYCLVPTVRAAHDHECRVAVALRVPRLSAPARVKLPSILSWHYDNVITCTGRAVPQRGERERGDFHCRRSQWEELVHGRGWLYNDFCFRIEGSYLPQLLVYHCPRCSANDAVCRYRSARFGGRHLSD